jgi:UDP-N-acetylmuramate dehydrogenase
MDEFPRTFERILGRPVRQDIVLRERSSFCIGGPARFYFEASTVEELEAAVRLCRAQGMPYYLIGSGTNILFDDAGFRGLILKNACRGVFLGQDGEIEALSGSRLSEVVELAARSGRQGMEFLAGIPGTVGGAVFGNAGAFGWSVGDILKTALLFDLQGREVAVSASDLEFRYRRSKLRDEHAVLLRAVFALSPGGEAEIRARMEANLAQRRRNHPPRETACAGCYFKNPVLADGRKVSAGKILEECGAKSLRAGDAAVSSHHANFIINQGRATAGDVLRLADELKRKVRDRCGYELEEEVIYLRADASMP